MVEEALSHVISVLKRDLGLEGVGSHHLWHDLIACIVPIEQVRLHVMLGIAETCGLSGCPPVLILGVLETGVR